jgi:hypothetical protein
MARAGSVPTRVLTTAAGASYLAGCALGGSVAGGLVDTRRIRWVHHALFASTLALTAAGALTGLRRPSAASALLAVAVAPLSRVAAVGAGDRGRHTRVALTPAPLFAASLVMAWWDDGTAGRDTR